MRPEAVLASLRAAKDHAEGVCVDPDRWDEELVEALVRVCEAFERLDRWLSRGGALPPEWATCNHPAVRGQRQRAVRLPGIPAPRPPQ